MTAQCTDSNVLLTDSLRDSLIHFRSLSDSLIHLHDFIDYFSLTK